MIMTQKLTILDIAKLAGVGKSTVSRVLTNDPKVKPATREKVEQVIRESGYVPSKSAQAMRGGSAKVVGIISVSFGFAFRKQSRQRYSGCHLQSRL